MSRLEEYAEIVDQASFTATAIPQFTGDRAFTLDEAYKIQALSIAKRYARGEKYIGVKMGFTSRAKAAQMGVSELIYGILTDKMIIEDGGELDLSQFVHPRVEPELALLLKAPLEGNVGIAQAYAAVEAVAPAIEVIDSRYENFKFSLNDVVADNSSSAALVLGAWQQKPEDPSNLGMILSFDGKAVQLGSTAAVLGHPIRALSIASKMLARTGQRLEAGDIILTGGATAAEALRPNLSIMAELEGLGRVAFRTSEAKS